MVKRGFTYAAATERYAFRSAQKVATPTGPFIRLENAVDFLATDALGVREADDRPALQGTPTPKVLNIRRRPPYNCRHTYATICSMSGMNPAFISQQLGHRAQMLLSTYARWINPSSDWSESEELQIGPKLVPAQISAP
ncbi:hypothetical protein EKA85_25830 [Pseudomonas veronii]|nr:hypothetical protein EKA85_25830 [Pseudomonas veronii]